MSRTSRRKFMKWGLSAAAWLTGGWPLHASWAMSGRKTGTLRFVFCTDVHASPGRGIPEALDAAAASIRRRRPDLVVVGGDLINEGYESSPTVAGPRWDEYMHWHRALGTETHAALGNHDLVGVAPADGSGPVTDPRSAFRQRLGLDQTWYSFDAVGCHFMILDSVRIAADKYRYHGYVNLEQQDWVRADLSSCARDTPIILVTHLPLRTGFFRTYPTEFDKAPPHRAVTNAGDVLDLFAHRNLLLVLQGHLHVEETLMQGATRFSIGGAICGNWWRGAHLGTAPGYALITLDGQRITWEYCQLAREG